MADLPLDWYGKSYLGRDVSIGVQGESPTGTPTSGVAAIPSGALGSTGPGPAAAAAAGPSAAAGGPSTGALTELGQGLQAAQLAVQGERIGSGLNAANIGETVSSAITGPGGQFTTNYGPNADMLVNYPGTGTVGELTPAAEGPVAPTAADVAATGTATAASAGAALGTAAEQFAAQQIPQGPRTNLEKSLLGAETTFALPIALPDIISGKLWGPPPSMPFPAATWAQLSNQVSTNLPQALPVPPNATDAQRQQIEQVNGLIGTLQPYTGGLIPQLQGVQSAESWKYAMDHIVPYIKGQFAQLQQLYPQAIQAMQPTPAPDLSVLRGPQQATGPAQQEIPAGFYRGGKDQLLQ